MNRTAARAGLRRHLDTSFKSDGYRFVAGREAYQRKFAAGEQRFHLRLISSGGGLQVEPSAAIRFDAVENVFHRTSKLSTTAQKDSATLWVPLQVLAETSRDEVVQRIASEGDLELAATALRALYEELVEPYFAKNSSLARADAIINEAPLEPCLHSSMPRRAAYGVILGALLERADLDSLIEQYQSAVGRIDRGFHLPIFEAVVQDLRDNPPSQT